MSRPVLIREVRFRNPYRIASLPGLARYYRAGLDARRSSLAGRAIRKLGRLSFRWLHATGIGGTGEMIVRVGDSDRRARFNARNLQFHSIYLSYFPNGPEPQLLALFDVLVADGGTFFDVGANWGYHAVAVAARPGFQGQVHAFEPVPSTFADLVDIVRQLGLADRITCHNVGVSDSAGSGTMVIPDGLHSGLAAVQASGAGGVAVALRPLGELGLPDPDVIKLDVEGHETAALRGAEAVLKRARPMIAFEDWFRPGDPEPLAYLTGLGYRLFLPAWWVEGGVPVRPGNELPVSHLTRLALVPLDPASRETLGEREDLLACPGERAGELESRFGFRPVD